MITVVAVCHQTKGLSLQYRTSNTSNKNCLLNSLTEHQQQQAHYHNRGPDTREERRAGESETAARTPVPSKEEESGGRDGREAKPLEC